MQKSNFCREVGYYNNHTREGMQTDIEQKEYAKQDEMRGEEIHHARNNSYLHTLVSNERKEEKKIYRLSEHKQKLTNPTK